MCLNSLPIYLLRYFVTVSFCLAYEYRLGAYPRSILSKQEWSTGRKGNAVDAYTGLLQMHNIKWFSDLSEALKHLRGVSILGSELSFEWGKAGVDLDELFGEIDS
jgi:hypothetical protein